MVNFRNFRRVTGSNGHIVDIANGENSFTLYRYYIHKPGVIVEIDNGQTQEEIVQAIALAAFRAGQESER